MATVSQAQRLIRVKTPLGDDVLVPTAFSGQEQISALFNFHLDVISADDAIAASDLVGKQITISIERVDDEPRFFDGFVSRLTNFGKSHDLTRYQVEVVPWLWFLTRSANCRIFQNKSIPDIVKQVFKEHGLTDFEMQLKGNFTPLEYCVQYRETAFNFISRLLEREGAFYFFKHEGGKHTMVIANSKQAYAPCPEQEVEFLRVQSGDVQPNRIDKWQHYYEFRPGKWAQTDYNFKTPSNSLVTIAATVIKLPGSDKFEIFDFPGDYLDTGSGQTYADLRMEENEAAHNQVSGTSSCKTFSPGHWFELTGHEIAAEDGEYVLTSVQHWASSAADAGGNGAAEEYGNTFTCIPKSVNFRPPRTTSRPMVRGPQVALVTGPAGEEIYTDKFGRVKIHFPWDRESKMDQNSSCWIRVSQVHASRGFGSIHTPRIGDEVIVVFYEGDPDRPVIAGRLYHAENMPPYDLPGGANVSGVKTNSTKGGGGHNGLIMDDSKGKEMMTLHAQKDLDATIQNNEKRTVVNGTQTVTVKGDTSLTVQAGNRSVSVASGDYTGTAKKAIKLHGQSEGVSITGDAKGVNVAGTGEGVNVVGKGGPGVKVDGTPNFEAHGASLAKMTSPKVEIGDAVIDIKGSTITIDGSSTIKLVSGGSSIEIAPGGINIDSSAPITITGAVVKVNS